LSFGGKSSKKLAVEAENEASEYAERLTQKQSELEETKSKAEQAQRLAHSQVTGLEEKVSALEIALVEKMSEVDALLVCFFFLQKEYLSLSG